jgi:phosphatidylglycerophosphate synthase
MPTDTAVLAACPEGGHRLIVGGLTVLERRVRELARSGVRKVWVIAEPVPLPTLPAAVEFVGADHPFPDDTLREPANLVAGIAVVDERSRRAAEWALLRRMNKSHEGPVDATLNWRVSMRITRLLARTAITPNHVTLVAIVVGLAAAALAATGTALAIAGAGVLLQLNSILDSCDGELARLRFQFSKLGQWLDNLADDLVDNVFLIALGVGLGGVWIWLGVAAAVGRWSVALYTYADVYRRTGTGDVFAFRWFFERDKPTADAVYDPRQLSTWLRSLGRRDTFVFVWMLACLAHFPYWVIGHGLVISLVQVGLLALHTTVYRR